MEILAIIPARGGSKGLPGKNIRELNGHPLIAYSILAAQKVGLINRIIVSTDSTQIAEIAKNYGAEVPFLRPSEYADDLSTDFDVFYYTLNRLFLTENYLPDYVVQLRPTSPVRFVSDLKNCIELVINSPNADSLRVVTASPTNPYKMWKIDPSTPFMQPLLSLDNIEEPFNMPRQKLPEVFWQVGILDVIKTSVILEKKSISGKNIIPYFVENKYAIDIDDINSFITAENVMINSNCIKFEQYV